MVCIYCGTETDITNSRKQVKTNTKWRRRSCPKCHAMLTSIEQFDLSKAIAVNSNGKHFPFSRDKLFISIYYSCKHLTKPEEIAAELTNTVITKLLPKIEDASLNTSDIIRTTAETLKRYNAPAEVQYLAYHPIK